VIDPFPSQHELISLFESEPRLTDPDLPWTYNTLNFELIRGDERVEVEIHPGYEQLAFRWLRGSDELAIFELRAVKGLEIDQSHETESLVVKFSEGSNLRDLRIRVRPSFHLLWGTVESWQAN
jgi:hypothetical protein